MTTREVFKLTTATLTTHNGYQWEVGAWRETDGRGELCGPGWLHSYSSPLVAVLHNPIHADIRDFRLWRCEARGGFKDDRGLKQGTTQLRLVEELAPAVFTTEQRAVYAILCALETYPLWAKYDTGAAYVKWANSYLLKTPATAYAAARAAYAAADAARAAADAARAAYAAADAAYAARAAYAAARADVAAVDFHALAEKALLVQ